MAFAAVTRDITLYRELAPANLDFDGIGKVYKPSAEFVPLFEHSPQRVLTALSQGFGDGGSGHLMSMLPSEYPIPLSLPVMSVLAPVTRAINLKKPLRLTYYSVTNGGGVREIVPLALVNSGARWHVRAFDRKRNRFLDLVPTRMEHPVVLEESPVAREKTAEFDAQWSRIMELDLVVHPDHKMPDVVARDYRIKDGVLRTTCVLRSLGTCSGCGPWTARQTIVSLGMNTRSGLKIRSRFMAQTTPSWLLATQIPC